MKKQIIAALTALALAVTLTACGDKAKEAAEQSGCRRQGSGRKGRGGGEGGRGRRRSQDREGGEGRRRQRPRSAAGKAADATKEAADKAVEAAEGSG